jgi:putative membrane protein
VSARRIFTVLIVGTTSLLAHPGEPLQPHDLSSAWRFDPGVIIPLFVSALLYIRGIRRSRGPALRRKVCFFAGLLTLIVALVSPLHPVGEVLFSAHMAQHEVLMLLSAPLMTLSRPLTPFLWGLPFEWRRTVGRWSKIEAVQRIWRFITAPIAAWGIHALALWVWHVPVLFQATITNEWVHTAQHLSFLLSALLFWWSLFYARNPAAYGAGVLYVFTTGVHTSILGALLTFALSVWYPAYSATAGAWGLSPLEDQQIGGLIMWVPGGLVYLAAGLYLFAEWLRHSDAVVDRRRYAD